MMFESRKRFEGSIRLLSRGHRKDGHGCKNEKPLGRFYTRLFEFTYLKLELCKVRVTVSSVLVWWLLELPIFLLELIMIILETLAFYRKY